MIPRLPFGSSLVGCVHRLARLQTTREMLPRPQGVSATERAIDRLIIAARRVVQFGLLIVLAATADGCATYGNVKLTDAQLAQVQADQEAGSRAVRALTKRSCLGRCFVLRVVPDDGRSGVGTLSDTVIRLRDTLYYPQWDLVRKVTLAHELSHLLLGHSRLPACRTNQALCEQQANQLAPRVLVAGWGMGYQDAVLAVYAFLAAGTRSTRVVDGHEDPCGELAAFQRDYSLGPIPGVCEVGR